MAYMADGRKTNESCELWKDNVICGGPNSKEVLCSCPAYIWPWTRWHNFKFQAPCRPPISYLALYGLKRGSFGQVFACGPIVMPLLGLVLYFMRLIRRVQLLILSDILIMIGYNRYIILLPPEVVSLKPSFSLRL